MSKSTNSTCTAVLPIVTMHFFNDRHACYDAVERYGADWQGTILDVLRHPDIPAADKLWALGCEGVCPAYIQRLCAVAFASSTPLADGRTVRDLMTDPRSTDALEVARRRAYGEATDEELAVAWAVAWAAAGDVARAAARAAAWAAAGDAAWAAAGDVAWAAAWAAARDVAWAAQIELAIVIIEKHTAA